MPILPLLNVSSIVEGAIYTRPPKHKHNTAIMIGGSDLNKGESLKEAVCAQFFDRFRVSIMLDSCGCNTTAAAGVALLAEHHSLSGKIVTVLAGTGPVGQRAAIMLVQAGAKEVRLTSRRLARAEQACKLADEQYSAEFAASPNVTILKAPMPHLTVRTLYSAPAKTGIQLLAAAQWQNHRTLEAMVDVNTQPPLGIEGINIMDSNALYHNRCAIFGGLAVGSLKLKLQRACVTALF